MNVVRNDLPRSHRCRWGVALFCCFTAINLAISVGCSPETDPIGRQKVTGVVTLDGAPIVDGAIRFEPANGEAVRTAGGAPISAGLYEIPVKQGLAPGKYRVFITGTQSAADQRSVDEQMNQPAPLRKDAVPAKYNEKSSLTIEVTPTGPNQHDFTLSKK